MTLLMAIKSGKPFKRKKWATNEFIHQSNIVLEENICDMWCLSLWDFLATDWELSEKGLGER